MPKLITAKLSMVGAVALLHQCRQQLQEIQQRHHLLERGTVMQAHRIAQARRAETSKVTLSLKAGP